MTKVFISYQTADGATAGKLQRSLNTLGINSFLAHEDIAVSEEWRTRILDELRISDIFVCLLSTHYIDSVWCIQEAGIAAFNNKMVSIPLRLDNSLPPGFLSAIQGVKCNADTISYDDVLPGFLKGKTSAGIDLMITIIERVRSFRGAEYYYKILLPYLNDFSNSQATRLLQISLENDQVFHAAACAREYIPAVLTKFPQVISPEISQEIMAQCNEYRGYAKLPPITLNDLIMDTL